MEYIIYSTTHDQPYRQLALRYQLVDVGRHPPAYSVRPSVLQPSKLSVGREKDDTHTRMRFYNFVDQFQFFTVMIMRYHLRYSA